MNGLIDWLIASFICCYWRMFFLLNIFLERLWMPPPSIRRSMPHLLLQKLPPRTNRHGLCEFGFRCKARPSRSAVRRSPSWMLLLPRKYTLIRNRLCTDTEMGPGQRSKGRCNRKFGRFGGDVNRRHWHGQKVTKWWCVVPKTLSIARHSVVVCALTSSLNFSLVDTSDCHRSETSSFTGSSVLKAFTSLPLSAAKIYCQTL